MLRSWKDGQLSWQFHDSLEEMCRVVFTHNFLDTIVFYFNASVCRIDQEVQLPVHVCESKHKLLLLKNLSFSVFQDLFVSRTHNLDMQMKG